MNGTDWMSACISIWSYSTSKAYVYERRMNWIWCFHRSMWVMVMLPLFWAYVCISKFSLDRLFLAKLVKVEKRPGARGVYVYVYVYCCLVWICYYVLTSYLICNCWVCTWTCGLSVGVCGMRALSELVHSCSNLDFGMWFVQCVWVWFCIVMCVLCMLVAPEIVVPVGLTGRCFFFLLLLLQRACVVVCQRHTRFAPNTGHTNTSFNHSSFVCCLYYCCLNLPSYCVWLLSYVAFYVEATDFKCHLCAPGCGVCCICWCPIVQMLWL